MSKFIFGKLGTLLSKKVDVEISCPSKYFLGLSIDIVLKYYLILGHINGNFCQENFYLSPEN